MEQPNISEIGIIRSGAQHGAKSVSTSAVIAAIGSNNLTGRHSLMITPVDGVIYWGIGASVTTSTGTPIQSKVTAILTVKDNVEIYLIAASSVDTRIIET